LYVKANKFLIYVRKRTLNRVNIIPARTKPLCATETHARFLSPRILRWYLRGLDCFSSTCLLSRQSLSFNLIIFVPSGSERDERSHCDSYTGD